MSQLQQLQAQLQATVTRFQQTQARETVLREQLAQAQQELTAAQQDLGANGLTIQQVENEINKLEHCIVEALREVEGTMQQ